MKIKVCDKNMDKLNAAIKEAEGKAPARTITAMTIKWAVTAVEQTLNIPKKHMEGIRVRCDLHAQKYPNAYKYTPESTQFVLERIHGAWYVTKIERYRTGTTEKKFMLGLTEDAKKALIERFEWF